MLISHQHKQHPHAPTSHLCDSSDVSQLKHFLFPVLLLCLLSFGRTGWITKCSTRNFNTTSEARSKAKVKISYHIVHHRSPHMLSLGLYLHSCVLLSLKLFLLLDPGLSKCHITDFKMLTQEHCIKYFHIKKYNT